MRRLRVVTTWSSRFHHAGGTFVAIYQWCPDGSLATKVPPAWWKRLDQVVTTRNLRTVERLVEVGGAAA